MLSGPAVPGCTLVSFHFLWAILCPQAVVYRPIILFLVPRPALLHHKYRTSLSDPNSVFQEKVVKLQRMINILHERYTQEQLDGMPQYQRLMSLYREGQFSISGFNYRVDGVDVTQDMERN